VEITVFLFILNVTVTVASKSFLTKITVNAIPYHYTILGHFGEEAFGRDGHGHASKSKKTINKKILNDECSTLQ
jgi:hypothetical protein